VIQRSQFRRFAVMGLLLAVTIVACHKEEKAVVGVAQNAVKAEHNAQAAAQATATERDQQRDAIALIPLPTKSMYVDVREPNAWANPFLSVGADTLSLRITLADANPSPVGRKTMLRPAAARRQEIRSAATRRMALWPRHRRRRVARGQSQGPRQGPPQRRIRHAGAQRPRHCRRRVAHAVTPQGRNVAGSQPGLKLQNIE
jgi:hypothetical protein